MQLWQGSLAELSGRRQLEKRGGVGALGCDCQEMSREDAKELNSFGAEPAADNNQAAVPRALELWICLVPLAPGAKTPAGRLRGGGASRRER